MGGGWALRVGGKCGRGRGGGGLGLWAHLPGPKRVLRAHGLPFIEGSQAQAHLKGSEPLVVPSGTRGHGGDPRARPGVVLLFVCQPGLDLGPSFEHRRGRAREVLEWPYAIGGAPHPPQVQSDHRAKERNCKEGKSGWAICGTHTLGSQTPPPF